MEALLKASRADVWPRYKFPGTAAFPPGRLTVGLKPILQVLPDNLIGRLVRLRRVLIRFDFSITIPDRPAKVLLALLMVYRSIRYGYAFRRIPLTQGLFAIVDPEDYPRLSRYKWRLCRTRGKKVLYAERSIRRTDGKYTRMLMHRQLMRVPDGYIIDHINGCGLDNRRANLRLATVAQNAWNTKKRNPRSGYKGVWFARDKGMWRASIVCNRKRKHLGYFKDKVEAAKAYDKAATELHKQFARLNFPEDREGDCTAPAGG